MQMKLIEQIETKLNEEESLKCEGEITKEEINKTKKKLTKRKATGIDGIPAEFWQTFDFVDEWLEEVFKEIKKRKNGEKYENSNSEADFQKRKEKRYRKL